MRMSGIVLSLLLSGLLAGTAEARTARAELKNAGGQSVGEATLEQTPNGVLIKANLTGLPPGDHAFHIHEVGKCDPPFDSAGGHFNPTGKKHGRENPVGAHAGDLPNIQALEGRPAKVEVVVRDVSLDGGRGSLFDGDGSALVIHDKADDGKTDPSGNAGARIACGVIRQ